MPRKKHYPKRLVPLSVAEQEARPVDEDKAASHYTLGARPFEPKWVDESERERELELAAYLVF